MKLRKLLGWLMILLIVGIVLYGIICFADKEALLAIFKQVATILTLVILFAIGLTLINKA